MAASQNYNVNLNIQANTSAAKQSLADLSAQLTKLSQGANLNLNAGKMTAEIQQASQAAMELQSHLQNATNAATGKLDFSKLNESIKRSNMTLMDYGNQLLKLGPSGQKAFAALATSISQAEVPLKRTSKLMTDFKTSLGNTIKWQISSSAIHGLIGGVQRAFGYAQDLNKSLTNIRIVTNQSTEQMANFALQANRAAKSLSTTTTEYTKASLIYYQQGLSDKEVQDRTNVTIKMANVTGQTAQTVADQMTAVWNNYDNGSKSLTHYADVMTALGASTASSTDEIAQGLQKFASISNTVGLSYEYAASALATVTATTRESADVVGNAFKTLFSRIQGLQLGETLDDGTTLNKYSQGLAKVGIQIKDSAGEMKSMDTILDEMGNKWGTLAQDEKMALAQTVAGVRQYTQLMALMENWDFFKENLGVANTATGTLEAQQKIYEQSWEASNNRLRASFEGLWDSLINSDSFIAFTDMLSGIVDMFNSITKALGGGGGVLSLLGAGLSKIYSKDLVRGINDISYGIRNMFGKSGAKEHIADLNSFVTAAQQRFQVTNDNVNSELFENTPNMAAAFSKQIGESAFMGVNFARFKDNLSLEQQAEFQNRMNLIQSLNAQSSQYATQLDEQGVLLADQASAVRRLIDNTSGKNTPEGESLNNNFNRYLYGRRAYGAANEYFGAGGLEHQVLLNNAGNPEAAMKAVKSGVTSFWNQFGGQLTHNFGSANFKQLMQNILNSSDTTSMAAAVNTFMDTLGAQAEGTIPQQVQGALRDSIGQAGSTAQSQGASQAKYSASSNNTAGMAQKLVDDIFAASQKGSVGKTIVGSAQALMLLNSSISSLAGTLETLSSSAEMKQTDKISGVVNGLISTVTTLAFGISALAKIPGIPIEAKVIIGIIAAIVAAIPSISKAFDAMNQGSLESAVEQAEAMKKAYEQVKNNDADLVKTITAYQKAQKALSSMTKGTEEWTQNLIEANEVAMKLISDHSISSNDYYRDAYGQIKISDEKLSQIKEDSRSQVLDAEMSKNLAENKATKELYQEELRDFSMGLVDTLVQKRNSLEAGKYTRNYGGQEFISYDSEEAKAYDNFIEQNGTTRVTVGSGRSVTEEIDNRISLDTIEAAVNYLANNDGVFTTPLSFLDADIGATATEAYLLAQHTNELQEEAYRQQQRQNAIDLQYQDDAEKALADQTFKNAEVMSSAGVLLQNTEKQIEETAESNYQENWKQIAEDYAKKLGFTDNKDFEITDWGWDKSQISYQFRQLNEDGTQYETITGAFEKDDLIAFEKGQITREELIKSAQQLDANLTTIANSEQTYGGALSSFITRQNYTGASISELNALLGALKTKDETTGKFKENVSDNEKKSAVAQLFKDSGFTDSQGNLDTARLLTMAQSEGFATLDEYYKALYDRSVNSSKMLVQPLESSINAKINNDTFMSKYFGDLNIEDLQNLENTISNLNKTGSEHGNQYIEGLLNVLDKVQGVDDKGALLSELLKINPSDVSALSAIMAAVDMAGGSFTDAGAAAQAFATAMAAIKPPDFNTLVSQLEQVKALLGDVFNLKPGTNISKELFEQIKLAFPELKNLFVEDLITGGYNYTGSQDTARQASRNAYLKNGKDIADQEALAKQVGKSYGNLTWGGWAEDYSGDVLKETTQVESGNTSWKTSSDTQGGLTNEHSIFGRIAAGNADSDIMAAAQQYYGDEYEALFNSDTGMMAKYDTAMTNMAQLVSEYGLETAKQMTEYQTAAADAAEASSQMLGFLQWLSDITGVDYKALQEEHDAAKGQLADGTDELRDMHNIDESAMASMDGSGTTLSSNENLQNYAENLAHLATQYPEVAEMASQLSEALMAGNYAMAEGLIPLVETEAALAAASAEYGHTTEEISAMASHLKELNKDNDQFQKNIANSPEKLAKISAEMLDAAEAADEWEKVQKDVTKTLRDTSKKGTKPYIEAMNKASSAMTKMLRIEDSLQKTGMKLSDDFKNKLAKNIDKVNKAMKGDFSAEAEIMEDVFKDLSKTIPAAADVLADFNLDKINEELAALKESGLFDLGDSMNEQYDQMAAVAPQIVKLATTMWNQLVATGSMNMEQYSALMDAMGFDVNYKTVTAEEASEGEFQGVKEDENPSGTTWNTKPGDPVTAGGAGSGHVTIPEITAKGQGGGGGGGSGGGGGGGGPKEPKKVANKRKSQTVKRYKRNDAKRSSAEKSKKSVENQKDYLYGETKISQMEKINKLAEKEAKITKDRIQESQKYLIEDRENLIKYMQKYGIEAEFDSEGFLKNYEQAWSKIYEEIAVLYEDNLLTEDEEKIEEDLNVKLEELEGVLEDYENSLEELADDIEKYEESLYEQYDNKIDAIQHKVEFKIELNEDDIEYIDFLLEVLGDTASYSVNRIELINQKMDALFNSISTIKEGIAEIYDISNDELQVFATGGLDIEGLLTEAQVEKLRELRDQLMEEMQALIEEYQKAMEEPLTVFDSWTEKIDHSIATVEHYSSILSQLRNVIDITGRDMYGFTDTFMRNLETITISQSLDTIAVNREYYESLIAQQAEAEAGLMQAREQGDEATIAKWEEIVRTTTEAAQSAREALVSGLENTLTLISDQFTAALEDAVKNFNDALYASGGLEGLSNDYSLMREHADLMAADYDKIYNLSKLTRNINKSLDDTKIIAGKQKLNSLLEEINALQATGVELSKYDLEYLEAKYNLYLAQIELENARNAKDTVTLSRDSEGNWAYVYTSNEEKIAEAEQKYEDALYEMQNKNHEYMEEMSSNMIAMTQQMQEEMAELNPADFANPEEYQQALQEIQDKYDKLLKAQNDELNKAIENNASLYETDWKNYSRYTGYKISDDEKWIDSFKETTLGHLIGSDSMDSDFQNIVYKLTTELSKGLSEAAVNYFKGIDEALKTYGTSIDEFGSNIINTTTSIRMESIEVGESIEDMASKMQTAFKDAADALKAFQETRLPEITTQLGEISTIISQINKDIRDSANIINDKDTSLIGDSKAVDLLNESGLFGTWTYNKRGDMDIVDENGNKTEGTNFQAYNAKLIEELDKARSDYQEGKITKEDLDEMYERYWMFKDIINRIYNSDNLVDPPAAFDTGGYTGEWGNAGKLAMLHQKELILNPDDTENFLEAIKLTKDMMSVLDFQIQYAKLGMGVLEAYDLQHQPSETVIEQQVTIQAEFPNVSDHNEVEEAIYNLINTASQYANRQ